MTTMVASLHRGLDLSDIQGNIVRPYGRFGFPITRHLFFHIGDAAAGRRFVGQVRHAVTTAQRWGAIDGDPDPNAPPRPDVAINIAFTFLGLHALGLPTRTLAAMPDEFIDGMAARWSILGDSGPSGLEHWDRVWQESQARNDRRVHVLISLNAQAQADGTAIPALAARTEWLRGLAAEGSGITLLAGHGKTAAAYQDSSALMARLDDGTMVPTPKENFGFTDGISDPAFRGQYEPAVEAMEVIGGGKLKPDGKGWAPLATGEFILGYPSEAQELPPSPMPWSFMRNGTFMAYRKLQQDVAGFHDYIDKQASLLHRIGGAETLEAARETLMAKMVGRWCNGFPLAAARTWAEAQSLAAEWQDIPAIQLKGARRTAAEAKRLDDYERLLTDFRYTGDADGARCPLSAHTRRTNPRDALDPTFGTKGATPDTALTNRRRIMRRGAPYADPPAAEGAEGDRGVIFMAICASLFRQFEFVQQQWVQYGSSFNIGNDTDPLVGLRRPGAKFVIPGDGQRGETPFICSEMPPFVAMRGGDYFFLPSLSALRQIAQGSVDPT
jgi:deferrochelatase/peroxidase EfeB